MTRIFWIFAGLLAAIAPASAAAIDPCVGQTATVNGHIVRVEVNGALVLDDGRAAMLEGIRLPKGGPDRAPDSFAHQAIAYLSQLARNRDLTLALREPQEDRYGRLRAQAFEDGDNGWLQVAMLEAGLARAEPMPARGECADKLYAAEADARAARRGIWSSAAYAVRTPQTLTAADTGTFQIVQGLVLNASVKDGRAYLNFGTDWKTDFTVTISPDDMPAFRAADVDPAAYAGKTIRARGMIDQMNGPEIEAGSPAAIEILPQQ